MYGSQKRSPQQDITAGWLPESGRIDVRAPDFVHLEV